MKRFVALLADMETAGYLTEGPDGDWVRAEDALAIVGQAKLYLDERNAALNEIASLSLEVAAAHTSYERAESEAAALRAENERLRASRDAWESRVEELEALMQDDGHVDAETLADANALLEDALGAINQDAWTVLADGIRAHLAGQPAAPVTTTIEASGETTITGVTPRTGGHIVYMPPGERHTLVTAAEQRVLELVAAWFDSWPRGGPEEDSGLEEERALYCAELARREGK